jgi:hypothetical protein
VFTAGVKLFTSVNDKLLPVLPRIFIDSMSPAKINRRKQRER